MSTDVPITRRFFLKDYPDVMDVTQVSELLGVSTKTVYKVIHNGVLSSIKIGREHRILKVSVIRYLGKQ